MLDQIPVPLSREGIKEREEGERCWGAIILDSSVKGGGGGGGGLLEEADYSRDGYYSRKHGTTGMKMCF